MISDLKWHAGLDWFAVTSLAVASLVLSSASCVQRWIGPALASLLFKAVRYRRGGMRLLAPHYPRFQFENLRDHTAAEQMKDLRERWNAAKAEGAAEVESLASEWLEEARAGRKSQGRSTIIKSACLYLLLAENASRAEDASSTEDQALTMDSENDEATTFYHYAANELRRADLLSRSAKAYFNAGLEAYRVTHKVPPSGDDMGSTFEIGIRSASQSRSMFDRIGEDEKADLAHTLRLDLKRRQSRLERNYLTYALLLIWGGLTRYGTSPLRWLFTLAGVLVTMTFGYCRLILSPALELHNGLPAESVVTAAFLSVVNLFAFGGYTNVTPQNWLGQLFLLFQSVLSFFWLGTGATFLTRR